ncbi:MAG: M15 family metallopeptidase [Oscillospiraceae bacterium]
MKKWIVYAAVILLLVGSALLVFGFLLPYHSAQNTMPASDSLVLECQPDAAWLLTWPEVSGADVYRVEIYQDQGKLLYREFAEDVAGLRLPQVDVGVTLTLRVSSGTNVWTLFGEKTRYSDTSLEAEVSFAQPEITQLMVTADGIDKTIRLDTERTEGSLWQYALQDSAGNLLEEGQTPDTSMVLRFGDGGDYAIPKDGESYRFRSRACRVMSGAVILGDWTEDVVITGDSLKFPELNPVLTECMKNTVTIIWDEIRDAYYEVQQLDQKTGSWNTVSRVFPEEARSCTLWQEAGSTCQYRVEAFDAQGESLTVSWPVSYTGRNLVQYATVWPVKDLAAYSSPYLGQVVDTALGGTAYCVLEETNGMFGVRIRDQICYIDSNYCMINLPDYVGGLCSYQITNSVSSIYAVHEFGIPNVTGVITAGYEYVCQEDGSYLVPLLYPTAKKLLTAARYARELGYRLKIYDSFRPYKATREIYDLTEQIMNLPLPNATYTGVPKASLELPEPREGTEELTYGWLMTGRNYVLNSFLAKNGSAHNLGIALDLTLENLNTGEELQMQTAIHDLSHYSVLGENNETADFLGQIMHGAGFAGLVSEWWHFQDDQARSSYGLVYVVEGVSAEGWVRDDLGWKYRTAKGSYYAAQTVTISGTDYAFDANGYVFP